MSQIATWTLPVSETPVRSRIAANFVWSLAGIAGSATAQWGVIAVLARAGSAATVGAYALAFAIAAPVFVLASLHLRALQSTDVEDEYSFSTYFSLRMITTSLAVVVLAIATAHVDRLTGWVLLGLILAKGFESVSDVMYGRLQREEKMDRIGQSMLWRAAGALCAMVFAMTVGLGMPAGVWMGAAVAGIVAAYDLRVAAKSFPREVWLQLNNVPSLALKAAPLGLFLALISLNANVPRYFLAQNFTVSEVGIFAALSYVAIAANTVVMAMGQAAIPSLARAFARRAAREFLCGAAPLLAISVALGATGIAVSAIAGRAVLSLLYGAEFASANASFRWMMIGGALGYIASAVGYLLSSVRCFQPQLPITAAALTVTALGCYMFVPAGGLLSAAKAQAAGAAVQLLLSLGMLASCFSTQFRRPA